METMQRLLKEDAAAELLGLSKRTLQSWRIRGCGPVFQKVGAKSVRYAPADLQQFVAGAARSNTSQ